MNYHSCLLLWSWNVGISITCASRNVCMYMCIASVSCHSNSITLYHDYLIIVKLPIFKLSNANMFHYIQVHSVRTVVCAHLLFTSVEFGLKLN